MSRLTRLVLVASVLASVYGLMVFVALTAPWSVVLLVVLTGAQLARNARRPHLTAHGTARMAALDDVRNAGMLDAKNGLILGRLATTASSLGPALRALFDRRVASRPACEQFLRVFRRRRNDGELVRLNNAVHSVVFAPTGRAKTFRASLRSCSPVPTRAWSSISRGRTHDSRPPTGAACSATGPSFSTRFGLPPANPTA